MAERNSSSSRRSERGGMETTPESRTAGAGTIEPGTSHTRQGSSLAEKVKERASVQLNTQKDRATEGLGTMAQAVRQSTQQLREQRHDTIAGYVEQAANQIDRLSQGLKNKDITELARDAQRLARRRPAVFVGSAFAIGLLGARFFKSSPPEEERGYGREPGREAYGGSGTLRGAAGTSSGPFAGGYRPDTPAGSTAAPGSTGTAAGVTGTGTSASPSTPGTTKPGGRNA